MTFNGIHASQFGCTKVTIISDRFTAPMTHQTVVKNGVVITAVCVPTVREISLELLVRERGHQALYTRLEQINDWLMKSGEAKLELRHTKGTYYKARCKNIEPPLFNGLTARLSVVMMCMDYRLYNKHDNKPVAGADPETDNFTFAGKHCLNDMHCMFVLNSKTAVPQVSAHKYEIPGIAGTVRYDDDNLRIAEKAIKGTLYFVNANENGVPITYEEAENRMMEVSAWLVNAGRASLIWDSDITRVYQVEVENEALFSRTQWENGKLDLTLTAQPLAMDAAQGQVEETLSLSAGTAKAMNIASAFPRGMGYDTPLHIEITNTGTAAITDLTIVYKDRYGKTRKTRYYSGGFSLSVGSTLMVDGEDMSSSVGSTNAAKWLYSGDYPIATVGNQSIAIQTASAATVKVIVKANARWV